MLSQTESCLSKILVACTLHVAVLSVSSGWILFLFFFYYFAVFMTPAEWFLFLEAAVFVLSCLPPQSA